MEKQIRKHKGEALNMAKGSTETTANDALERAGKQLKAAKQLGIDPSKIAVPEEVEEHVCASASAKKRVAASLSVKELEDALAALKSKKKP